LWDPDKGYITRQGFDAYNPDAQQPVSVSKDTDVLMRDLGAKYSENLNERQLKLFNEQWKTLGRDYVGKMLKHELSQREVARKAQLDGMVSGLRDSVSTLPLEDVDNFLTGPQGLTRINGYIERTQAGLGTLATAKIKADIEADLRSTVIGRLSSSPATLSAADQYVEQHKDVLGELYPRVRDEVNDKIIKADDNAEAFLKDKQDNLATKFKLALTDTSINPNRAEALRREATIAHAKGYLNDDNLLAIRKACKSVIDGEENVLSVSKTVANQNEAMLMEMRRTGRWQTARSLATQMFNEGSLRREAWMRFENPPTEPKSDFDEKAKRVKSLVSNLYRGSILVVDEDLNQRRSDGELEYEIRVFEKGEDPYTVYKNLRDKEYSGRALMPPDGYFGELSIKGLKEYQAEIEEKMANDAIGIREGTLLRDQIIGTIQILSQREEQQRNFDMLFGDKHE
jgi:hypothetical protein